MIRQIMQERISVLIIDSQAKSHDYSPEVLNSKWCCNADWQECEYNVCVIEEASHVLEKLTEFREPDIIITVGRDAPDLSWMSFEWRKRWVWTKDYDIDKINNAIISTFIYNIGRKSYKNSPVFSFFTSVYNTPTWQIERLYSSLVAQTYSSWNWWIIDDSSDDEKSPSSCMVAKRDPRIHIIKNVTDHGVIGFNKHVVAMAADGDWLIEMDHDDDADPAMLECMCKALEQFPDADFIYSDCLELYDGDTRSVWYGDAETSSMALKPEYSKATYNGVEFNEYLSNDINYKSIRTIYYQPNHLRAWRKSFYHKINGHLTNLSVLDDMDIIIRTFLNDGVMVKIPKCLYYQHLGGSTQAVRNREIQRVCRLLYWKYDKSVHEKLLEKGYEDPDWDENAQRSDIYAKKVFNRECQRINKVVEL